MPRRLTAVLAALCALAACGDGSSPAPPPQAPPGLSARELIDATDAIEKLVQVAEDRILAQAAGRPIG